MNGEAYIAKANTLRRKYWDIAMQQEEVEYDNDKVLLPTHYARLERTGAEAVSAAFKAATSDNVSGVVSMAIFGAMIGFMAGYLTAIGEGEFVDSLPVIDMEKEAQ